jgi:3-dehydro-L-gulonate-6-phosphate decarboxylase
LYPEAEILADIRIAEAGKILSTLAFAAGASLVTVVAGASLQTVAQVVSVAALHRGGVQVELADEWYDPARARAWFDLGVRHVIVKRSRDREAAGDLTWDSQATRRIDELAAIGFTVSVTGGISAGSLDELAGHNVGIVIAGRTITTAADPLAAVEELRAAMRRAFP